MKIPKIKELFDLTHTKAQPFIDENSYGHEILEQIPAILKSIENEHSDEYEQHAPGVLIAKDATVSPLATIEAPAIIGHHTEVRPGAYIRGNALIGDDCVIGNSTEIKNAILFDGVQVPHYNYVGDSILGYRAHLGAGSICSNYRADHGTVILRYGEERIETGRRKLGAMIADHAEIGCGAVLCPGAIIGQETNVYPLSLVRGVVPSHSIFKSNAKIVEKENNSLH